MGRLSFARYDWGPGELVLGLCLLLLLSSFVLGAPGATAKNPHTELTLLTENETGSLTAANYPTSLSVGDEEPVTVSVRNREGDRTDYTLFAIVQQAEVESGETSVSQQRTIERHEFTLEDGERWRQRQQFSPLSTAGQQRVMFLLYKGTPPARPATDTADQTVFLWLSVSESDPRATGGESSTLMSSPSTDDIY